jgi:uncharacterized protein YndB with AHSA1/START domain
VTRTDSASRLVRASRERVFHALTDPDELARWLPPTGMHGRFEAFDLRPGGSYRLVLEYDDPSVAAGKATPGSDVVEAEIVELIDGERLVQAVDFVSDDPAFSGTMTMAWRLSPSHGGTVVDIVATGVPRGISKEDHITGMESSLANLAALVEQAVEPDEPS